MWPEVEEAATKKRHEIRLTGKKLVQRLEENLEGLEELATACPHLTFVDLSDAGASLDALPANFSQLVQLHELKCIHNALKSLPSGLGVLPLLRTIILEGNMLQELPADLFKLPRLHTLNASHNQLTALPDQELLAASELHYLDVSHNKLPGLPASISRLPKLSTLIASYNPNLTHISHAHLHVCRCSHNKLPGLPASISKLPKLSTLIASYNPDLASMPSKLSALSVLSDLQMAHCGLKAVPQALAAAPKLKSLQLEGNPFDDKKLPKVLKEGRLKNIITHLKKHGAPPDAAEAAEEAAAAAAKLQLSEAAKPFKLLPVDKDAGLDVAVHAEVKDLRPYLVCAVLKGVHFTPTLYDKFIQLQTDLHEGPCKRRSVAAIGTHDLDKLQLPLRYEALPPADVSFVPLNREKEAGEAAAAAAAGEEGGSNGSSRFKPGEEITAAQLGDYFAGDKSMLKYLSYIQDRPKKADPLYAVLRDASGAILSVSPVINAEPCKITADSTNVLIEVSGTESLEFVQQVATEFLERFAQAYKAEYNGKEGSQGGMLQVAPVRLLTPLTGHVRLIWPPKA